MFATTLNPSQVLKIAMQSTSLSRFVSPIHFEILSRYCRQNCKNYVSKLSARFESFRSGFARVPELLRNEVELDAEFHAESGSDGPPV